MILIINPGSTSIKFKLFDNDSEVEKGNISFKQENLSDVLESLISKIKTYAKIQKIGVRVVHGANLFSDPVKFDLGMAAQLEQTKNYAPLHMPITLDILHHLYENFGSKVDIFCIFDTAFHHSISPLAAKYAIPTDIAAQHGIKRYGFHGIAHQHMLEVVKSKHPKLKKVITCQLGGGASISAIRDGVCVDTTMGFGPNEGLMMATRCGDIGVDAVLRLVELYGVEGTSQMLNYQSGLLGVSGVSSDMSDLLKLYDSQPNAKDAIDMYVYRIVKQIAAFWCVLGGLDALIFSGGVGYGSAFVRQKIIAHLGYMRASIDKLHNENINAADLLDIATMDSICRIFVVKSDEEKVIRNMISI